ncbi:shikimate dehydrogenase family protein [Chondrinema litorale]|uniref:shikimate dehydrogenase family protein n=1 Tax=Chondrinema litorale TaxID=2994555 RepID=UPI002542AD68|nr:shikimate dehydrogenase [Chondrinema litorale]UZR92585.1 shikimate dehydrogenase [Chondrinema litorale]
MKLFGLIGYPLSHSFSKKYFTEKFQKEGINDAAYELFELKQIEELPELLESHSNLHGLNVTIPYKEKVKKYLDDIDAAAEEIGAVNVIKINNGKLKGYNSDYFGFKNSLISFLDNKVENKKALILGTGGAAKAVKVACKNLAIEFLSVSRKEIDDSAYITYQDIDKSLLEEYTLIVNTTPLGMSPKIDTYPDLPYSKLTSQHYLYDLVYNPDVTAFMQKGQENGAKVINGLDMLIMQAEEAWRIWNNHQ